jgi:hypothetical protein
LRTVAQVPHPQMRIMIFVWNGKYIVEFEIASMKQAFKIDQTQMGLDELQNRIDVDFQNKVMARFKAMNEDLKQLIVPS